MIFEPKMIIEKDLKKYIVLDVIKYQNKEYAFVNKVTDDEKNVTKDYYIFYLNEDKKILLLENIELINILLPIFQKNLEKIIQEVINNN